MGQTLTTISTMDAEGAALTALPIAQVVAGQLYHSLGISNFQYIEHALVGVSTAGKIAFVEACDNEAAMVERLAMLQSTWGFDPSAVTVLTKTQFLIPGFVDTHIHAPQYVFTGTGYDLTLLKWLEKYTFPREAAFGEPEYALDSFTRVVRRTLRCGTTTACYYATTHLEAAKTLADVVAKAGQRAFIGKVNMDRNSPDYYTETTDESIQATCDSIDYIRNTLKSSLITPVLTPRFVPTCSSKLMRSLGDLAVQHGLPIQSHLSETPSEIAWVCELHPECKTYTDVYDEFGLLTEKTIMAHCVHLNRHERDLLKARGVGISHCPNSNFCLQSGMLNLRRLVNEGHSKIGLGTDCAGGYSPSIMDAMRQAIVTSKVIHVTSREQAVAHERLNGETSKADPEMDMTVYDPLTFSEAFYLATLGGAKAMALEHSIGNIVAGKSFDVLLVDLETSPDSGNSTVDIFKHDDAMSLFEKFIYLGDDRNIKKVFVQGRLVST
ncbi:guanine deaminase [Batrachochytrium salamandrivorans]|nr:hypothetical protein BASA62_009708 [Batrachochytrium salamandrivorans]KAH9261988.1 guanine deaminase [Batrachochytrium salamandrivorans]